MQSTRDKRPRSRVYVSTKDAVIEERWWREANSPPPIDEMKLESLYHPGTAGHEGRDSPKSSTKKCQLESHGAVLSLPIDSSWAPGL